MNRKLMVSLFLALVVMAGTISAAFASEGHQPQQTPGDFSAAPQLFLDSLPLSAGPTPMVEHDLVLLPLRATAEAAGALVTWDPVVGAASVQAGSAELVVRPNSAEAVRDGRSVSLGVSVREAGGRLFVPAEFLAEFLDLELRLVPEVHAVALLSGAPKVYVANEYADTVSVINAATNRKIKDIKLELPHAESVAAEHADASGGHGEGAKGDGEDHKDAKVIPHNIQVAPDGRYVYTANAGTNSLGVFDA